MEYNRIIQGDTKEVLKTIPKGEINCIVTSPPYFSLRDYNTKPQIWDGDKNCKHEWGNKIITLKHKSGETNPGKEGWFKNRGASDDKGNNFCLKCGAWRGCLGLEPNFELYIKHLCDIFDEAKRVLRKDGTCWINIGDTYWGGGQGGTNYGGKEVVKESSYGHVANGKNYQAKSLCLIPQHFAIEMVNRGWILRNIIIWHKPNCMPSSAKDRFTVDFEYVYFFVKNNKTLFWVNEVTGELRYTQPLSKKGIEGKDWHWLNNKKVSLWHGHDYWFEQQIEKTSAKFIEPRMMRGEGRRTYNGKYPEAGVVRSMSKNKRAVWTISTKPFPGAHFAVYPEKLIEPMIQAGCPKYVCKKCGKARVKIYKTIGEEITKNMRIAGCNKEGKYKGTDKKDYKSAHAQRPSETKKRILESMSKIKKSYYSDCGCNAGFEPGIVLDPFMGAGTTAVVAKKQGKQYLGIELKQEYIDIANKRIKAIPESLF